MASTNTHGFQSITLTVNGLPVTSAAPTLAAFLAEAGYGDDKIATARNGEFVPERKRSSTPLTDGDRIEIVAPRQGG